MLCIPQHQLLSQLVWDQTLIIHAHTKYMQLPWSQRTVEDMEKQELLTKHRISWVANGAYDRINSLRSPVRQHHLGYNSRRLGKHHQVLQLGAERGITVTCTILLRGIILLLRVNVYSLSCL